MESFKITIATDDPNYSGEVTANWDGYGEQNAIVQAFLYHAQNGARSLKVLSIEPNK